MREKRIDLLFVFCILLGVVVILLAGFHNLGVDIRLPALGNP
jgi:hypothetical protein